MFPSGRAVVWHRSEAEQIGGRPHVGSVARRKYENPVLAKTADKEAHLEEHVIRAPLPGPLPRPLRVFRRKDEDAEVEVVELADQVFKDIAR